MEVVAFVDETLCRSCGECVRECVRHVDIQNGNHVDHAHPQCTRCLHCYAVCPAGAIQLSVDSSVRLDGDGARDAIAPERLEHFLSYRRSTRRFQDRPVERELIEGVVQAGRYVPSGGNRHSHEFTVITEPATKERLLAEYRAFYRRIARLMERRLLLALARPFLGSYERAFLTDPDYSRRMKDLLDRLDAGDDPVFYGAPAVVMIHSKALIPTPEEDSILAGYNIVLTAQALGLGSCFVSLAQKATNGSDRCKAILGLTPEDQIHAVVLLGYPAVRYRRAVPKLPRPIHWA